MAGKNEANDGESENSLIAPLTADKFQGFATKDGEVIKEPAPKAAAKVKAVAADPVDDAADDTADAPDTPEDGQTEGKPSKSAQIRINKAIGKQRAAERRAEAAEAAARAADQRMARLEGQMALLTGGANAPNKDAAPNPEDYKNGDIDARYIADLARYEGRKAAKDARASDETAAKQELSEKAAKALQKRIADFDVKGSEKYEDFHEVVFDDDFPLPPTVGELALESDHGVEILYALAGNAKEARRVAGLTPARQAAWFGAREAELSSGSSDADEDEDSDEESPSPKTTQSPQPSSFKTRGAGGVPRVNAATPDFAAFERMAKAQNGR